LDGGAFSDQGVSPHRALCWLIREAVDLRGLGGVGKGRFKRAFREAEDALRARGLSFEPLSGERLDMLIAKPNAVLPPAEVATLGLIADLLLEGLSEPEVATLRERAVARARSQPGTSPRAGARPHDAAADLAALFEGAWRPDQTLLADLAGDYLIFRCTPHSALRQGLIVSMMTLTPSPDGLGPARFRTVGAGSGKDERVVEGMIFESNAASGVLYALGRDLETGDLRNALLVPTAKPVHALGVDGGRPDLKGVRLSLGRFTGAPRAYRIWCARVVDPPLDGGDWRDAVKDYRPDESLHRFEGAIPGFGWIRRWLDRPVSCALEDEDDPPTP
jgi:hypothetical protein